MATAASSFPDYLALCDEVSPFKASIGPKTIFASFDPSPRSFSDDGMAIQFNQDVPMRDGVRLRADIFRPLDARPDQRLPVVLAITPYGKQNPFDVSAFPPSRDFDPGFNGVLMSKYTVFEGSDPVFWTKRGFAYVAIDSRGSYASEGQKANFVSKADAVDGYDAVEHFAALPWSNGHVGMIGASALGAIQWQVAAIRPPHLSGILVQDGYTDLYRELAFKGGVLHPNFMSVLDDTYRAHGNEVGTPLVHLAKACEQHPYFDDFWELYTPKIEDIACPIYIVCSLADNGLHTPGTIRGWLAATSETKFLELHPYKKWEWQLTHESLDRQAAFFNKVLHGPSKQDAASTDFWPRVRLHVTEKFYAGSWRNESTYPLARTVRTRYNLTADGGLESTNSAQEPHVAQFHAHNGSLTYTIKFPKPTEVTGSSRLHLLFAVDGEATDADIFVTLQKRDIEGNIVYFPYHTFVNEGHVAWGWLRASRRTLSERAFGDEIAHTHLAKDAQLLVPNKAVHLDINIQPTATHFRTGESLVLVIQGRDFGEFGPQCQVPRAGTGINEAVTHSVLLEGSFLELPIIPHHLSS